MDLPYFGSSFHTISSYSLHRSQGDKPHGAPKIKEAPPPRALKVSMVSDSYPDCLYDLGKASEGPGKIIQEVNVSAT